MPVVSCGSCALCVGGRPNLCPNRVLMGLNFPGGFAEAYEELLEAHSPRWYSPEAWPQGFVAVIVPKAPPSSSSGPAV